MQARRVLATDEELGRELDASIGSYRASLTATRLLAIIGIVSMATLLAVTFLGLHWWAIAVAGLASIFLIVLAEAPVRPLAAKKPDAFLERVAIPLTFLCAVTRPVTRIVPLSPDSPFMRQDEEEEEEGDDENKEEATGVVADAQEFKQLVEDLDETPELRKEEKEMIGAILALKETAVKEIMVPRPDFTAVSTEASYEDLLDLIAQSGRSRIPLYEGSMDNIVGVVHVQDVFKHAQPGNALKDLRQIARRPFFVPENKNVYELLDEFRDSGVHFALVVDEYGGVEGLVTLNDVLEEIVGGLVGKFDREAPSIRMVREGEAIVEGSASLEEINDALGTDLEDERVETIGGFVLHHLGHIPKLGETLSTDGIEAQVVSTAGRRIKRLRIKKAEAKEREASKP